MERTATSEPDYGRSRIPVLGRRARLAGWRLFGAGGSGQGVQVLAQVAVLANAASALVLTGLVWVVQLVVYPGLRVDSSSPGWPARHAAHVARMGWVVAVPWAVQALSCAVLLVARPPGVPLALALLAGGLGLSTVVLTVALSLPAHARLERGYDDAAARRLIRTNWYRTAAWSAAAAVGVWLVVLAAE